MESGDAQRPVTSWAAAARGATADMHRAIQATTSWAVLRGVLFSIAFEYTPKLQAAGPPWGPAAADPVLRLRRRGQDAELQFLLLRGRDLNFDLIPLGELAQQDLLGERILDVPLNRPLERTSAVVLVVPVVD